MVTEHYLSAEAGFRMLSTGGNAFDAAVAATLAEGVLNPHMHTFGGELSALGLPRTTGECSPSTGTRWRRARRRSTGFARTGTR